MASGEGVQGPAGVTSIAVPRLPGPVAASQLSSNQWKSLIILTSRNAVELSIVPSGARCTMQTLKSPAKQDLGMCSGMHTPTR